MPERTYTAGRFALELDGTTAGLVSAEGGYATGDVVTMNDGSSPLPKKHLSGYHYEPLRLTCDSSAAPLVLAWLSSTLDGKNAGKNGALLRVDATNKVVDRLEFTNALLTEVAFPALDGASKDPVQFSLRADPEIVLLQKGGGGLFRPSAKVKAWASSNFRLAIDGVDCSRVAKVEPPLVRCTVARAQAGEERLHTLVPTGVEIGDLVVTVAETGASDFFDWHDDFVVKGNNGDDREKSGTLELLAPTTKETLLTLTFGGLGIYKLARQTTSSATDAVARVTATMYCETLAVDVK